MKNYFVDQMLIIRQYSFNISAKNAVNGISASKIKYYSQWSK
ncbi:MAG: hypothetical protein ACRC92_00765 [Peptostreptococcaceae bacterium]